ncbi:hypothetical protein ACFO4O_01530 [Glaciecola siphonariae]|uniref:Uncharacterized protein n=1 Tax=Glaciecola siphonariae TaxID=521012 RepID=A0ABV9LQR5_9ALTE
MIINSADSAEKLPIFCSSLGEHAFLPNTLECIPAADDSAHESAGAQLK